MNALWLFPLCLLAMAQQPAPSSEPQKWALLVGINQYRNLPDLQGAVNDVADMKDLLVKKLAFPEAQIATLLDAQATREAILEHLQSHLIDRVRENDIVVFYYSGHGSQMIDLDGDEPDGKDETLVPHDSRQADIFDISDDEIGELLNRLSRRSQNVTFIFDSCHSGSGQRAGSFRHVLADKRQPPKRTQDQETDWSARSTSNEGPGYVMLSACRDTEVATEIEFEGRKQGALTHELVKALRKADGLTTWNQLMDNLVHAVHGHALRQTPQLHGRGERVIFGLKEIPAERRTHIARDREGKLVLAAGQVHGMTVGSTFALFGEPGGAQASFGQAILEEVGHFESIVKQISGEPIGQAAWATEQAHHYDGSALPLFFEEAPRGELREALDGFGAVRNVAESEAYFVVSYEKATHRYLLRDREGSSMKAFLPDGDRGAIRQALAQWAHWYQVLKTESSGSATPNVGFTIGKPSGAATGSDTAVFYEHDELIFTVTNHSRRNLFITLLGLSDRGEIGPIHPEPGEVQQPIPPGKSWSAEIVVDPLPTGETSEKTILKLFATMKPIDLRMLYQAGARSPVDAHPLESLLTTGARAANQRPARWTALHRVALIQKKNP